MDIAVYTSNGIKIEGFLHVNGSGSDIPGNMGLKDQVLALKWVQKNIKNFGGDPKNVTIFGESAGSASVHYHILSPMSKGLFQKAVCQSGSVLNPWAFRLYPTNNTLKVAEYVGCNDANPKAMVSCFQKASLKELTEASVLAVTSQEVRRRLPLCCKPTLDGTFLPMEPSQIILEGRFNKVPLLVGVNSGEGILLFNDDPDELKDTDEDLEMYVPSEFYLTAGSAQSRDIADKIRAFYLKGKHLESGGDLQPLVDLRTDVWFLLGVDRAVRRQSQLTTESIFYYQFLFEGHYNFLKLSQGKTAIKGACHADEIFYIFKNNKVAFMLAPNITERKVIDRMVTMWTNFAKTGNPTPEITAVLPVKWEPYSIEKPFYMAIDKDLTLKSSIEKKRMDFWDPIYKKFLSF